MTSESCVEELSCEISEELVVNDAASVTPVIAEPGDDTDKANGECNDESTV